MVSTLTRSPLERSPFAESLTYSDGITELVCEGFRASDSSSERAMLEDAIAHCLEEAPEGGRLDSHALSDVAYARRCAGSTDVSLDQTRDYMQYLLREAPHVCRKADGHVYRVHRDEVCSKACGFIRAQVPRRIEKAEFCKKCFLQLPTSGVCGSCC